MKGLTEAKSRGSLEMQYPFELILKKGFIVVTPSWGSTNVIQWQKINFGDSIPNVPMHCVHMLVYVEP